MHCHAKGQDVAMEKRSAVVRRTYHPRRGQGRPGWVPARFQRWTDSQVAAAGSLLRSFHDATRGSRLAGGHPAVCHHDPGPNNTVFADNIAVAFIDFDTAAPGDPIEDLGYMAWTWCISSKPTAPPATVQAAQLRALADAYRLDEPSPASSMPRSTARPATPGGGTAASRTCPHASPTTTRSPSASGGPSRSTPTLRPTAQPSTRPWADKTASGFADVHRRGS
ncbi:phosphotransferase [Streptomyces boninensis]|uniref:phosphotransferase family protein n=1 Tax=Streptomyces boninensis TaxID=2039455 RepID=UPI003B225642